MGHIGAGVLGCEVKFAPPAAVAPPKFEYGLAPLFKNCCSNALAAGVPAINVLAFAYGEICSAGVLYEPPLEFVLNGPPELGVDKVVEL